MTRLSLQLMGALMVLSALLLLSASAWGQLLGGDTLAYIRLRPDRHNTLMRYDVRQHISTPMLRSSGQMADWRMAWSPDGQYILFTSNRASDNPQTVDARSSATRLFAATASGRDIHAIGSSPRFADNPTWSDDGAYISYTANTSGGQPDIFILPWAERLNPDAQPRNLTQTQTAREQHHVWSGDGSSVLYTMQTFDREDVIMRHTLKGDAVPLTDGIGGGQLPTWSHDGALIAFLSMRYGRFDAFIMAADGSQQRRIDLPEQVLPFAPVWSPDGKHLLVHGAGGALYIYHLDDDRVTTIANRHFAAYQAQWSPDGRMISLVGVGTDGAVLYLWHMGTQQFERLTMPDLVPILEKGTISAPQWQPMN